jgi:hypothetical protein
LHLKQGWRWYVTYLEGEYGVVPLELAFCHGASGALAQVPELDDPLLHAHDAPTLVVEVLHVGCAGLLQGELVEALEKAALPVHVMLACVGI